MRPVRALSGVLVAAALVLTGCGGTSGPGASNGVEKLAAQDIIAKSQTAAKSATSVHIKGTVSETTSSFGIDMHLQRDKGAQGTVSIGTNQVEILRIGTDAYLKGDAAFWTSVSNATVAAKLADKYVKGSTSDNTFSSFVAFTDLTKIFDQILTISGTTLTKTAGKTVSGVPTIGVNDADAKNGGTVYVATKGKPYPMLIEPNAGSGNAGGVMFDQWDTPVTLTPPPADQVLDLSSLG